MAKAMDRVRWKKESGREAYRYQGGSLSSGQPCGVFTWASGKPSWIVTEGKEVFVGVCRGLTAGTRHSSWRFQKPPLSPQSSMLRLGCTLPHYCPELP